MSFEDPLTSFVIVGVGWAVLLPMLVKLAARFDGHPVRGAYAKERSEGYAS